MLRLTYSICWLASSDVTGDTSKRARGCGQPSWGVVSGLLKATSAGHHIDQSRSDADAPGRMQHDQVDSIVKVNETKFSRLEHMPG